MIPPYPPPHNDTDSETNEPDRRMVVASPHPSQAEKMLSLTVETIDLCVPQRELNITITLPTGNTQPMNIPAPTKSDIKWAKKWLQRDFQDRSHELRYRANEKCLWRIYFLLEQNKLRDNTFLDINYCSDTTALGQAANSGQDQNLLLLLSYGADIHKAKSEDYTPIRRAVNNDKLDTIDLLFSCGATIDGASIIKSNGYNATKTHAINALMEIQKQSITAPQSQLTALPAPSTQSNAANPAWVKMDDQIIAHVTEAAGRFRLNKIFNFRSREIERFTESLNTQGQVIHVGTPVTQEFESVRHSEEIQAAHIELTAQNGAVEPIQHYIRHTKHIQRRQG